jgi:hypothetical protein
LRSANSKWEGKEKESENGGEIEVNKYVKITGEGDRKETGKVVERDHMRESIKSNTICNTVPKVRTYVRTYARTYVPPLPLLDISTLTL